MSWLRTAVALIGFGFAIVQYMNHLQQIRGARPAYLPTAPEYLGLALILCGILALVISIWQYRWSIRYLWGEPFEPLAGVTNEGMQSPVMAVAILLIIVGLFAFFASAVPPHLARPAEQPGPTSTFETTRPTKGDRDG
jgi:putative membrane protein